MGNPVLLCWSAEGEPLLGLLPVQGDDAHALGWSHPPLEEGIDLFLKPEDQQGPEKLYNITIFIDPGLEFSWQPWSLRLCQI